MILQDYLNIEENMKKCKKIKKEGNSPPSKFQ